MKTEIDQLTSQIRTALAEESVPPDQIDPLLRKLKLKGIHKAVELRNALVGYANDPHLSIEDRAYAKKQLEDLPEF